MIDQVKRQICPICEQPVKSNHPNAKVYHLQCAVKACSDIRAKVQAVNPNRAIKEKV